MSTKYLIIDGYQQIIEYKSPEAERKSRINVTELLGDGGLNFHKSGTAEIYKTKFTTFIPQTDKEQLNYFDEKIRQGEPVLVLSTFNHIPTGEYYYTGTWKPIYHDEEYYKIDWELTLIGENDTDTDNYTESVTQSLNKDTTTFQSSNNTLKEGNTDTNQNTQLQMLLQYNGFYLNQPIDGIWSTQTTTALQQYQQAHNLTVTGTLNTETKQSLRW